MQHVILQPAPPAEPPAPSVCVVAAHLVADLRRRSPYAPIVALVTEGDGAGALTAQAEGATVVLPCADPAAPDPDLLARAVALADARARREQAAAEQTARALHQAATNASAVGMVGHLVGGPRGEQLQRLATEAGVLAWRAGGARRLHGRRWVPVEVTGLLAEAAAAPRPGGPTLEVAGGGGPAPVLADPAALRAVLDEVVANAEIAGATRVHATAVVLDDQVLVTLADDGDGLATGMDTTAATAPFASGWVVPRDGLGLAEAAETVADLGGSLALSPATGRGTTVTFTLPLLQTGQTGRSPASSAVGPPATGTTTDGDRTLSGVLEHITRRAPLSTVLDALGSALETELPGSRASLLLLDRFTGTLHHGAGKHLPGPYRDAIDGLAIGPDVGSCGTAAHTRAPVVVEDISTDVRWERFRELALAHDLRSCWSSPIIDDERDLVLGTFAVYHPHRWTPDAAAQDLVQRLTYAAAIAIRTAELHDELIEREALFRGTFEHTAVGIALVDPDGVILQANPALETMVDGSPVGHDLVALVHPDDAEATRALLAALATEPGAGAPRAEIRLQRAGDPLWTAMSGTVIPRGDDRPSWGCIEVFDLTERRRVAQARREQAMAEAANTAKSELIATVSHELRTPLNAVLGFAQVLRSLELRPEQRRDSIDHILNAGRHLLQTINDLVDLSGTEAGHLPLELATVRVDEVLTEATDLVAGLAADRRIALRWRSAGDLSAHADPHRLRQVLVNLLGNAIKFTPPDGHVTVTADLDADRIRLCVADSGRGIPLEHQHRLFTPFERLSSTGEEGSGLGLALCRVLVEAMGGTIGARSQPGHGSEFTVELPAA